MSLLNFRWVRDSQSGIVVVPRIILATEPAIQRHGVSEEIKIEALKTAASASARFRFSTPSRLGEVKLNPWRDGL